jgi:hypothetical protein
MSAVTDKQREEWRAMAERVPQDEPALAMWAGSGWPLSLVRAFELDVPEAECGVWWPLAQDVETVPEDVDRPELEPNEGSGMRYVAFCADERLQARLAGAALAAPALARAVLSLLDEVEKDHFE